VVLFSASVAVIWLGYGTSREKTILATAVAIFLLAVIGFGEWRLHSEQQNVSWVSVGLLASDLPENMLPSEPGDAQRSMQDHAGQVQALLQQGAQVVVAPEKIVVLQEENIKAVDDLFAQAAAASSSDVVIGVARCAPKEWLNEARLHAGACSCTRLQEAPYVAALRIKIHRWQLANNSAEPSGLWGVTICKDMDFPGLSREYGQEGGGRRCPVASKNKKRGPG
jgi:apolipoprotein N-acyltransferase